MKFARNIIVLLFLVALLAAGNGILNADLRQRQKKYLSPDSLCLLAGQPQGGGRCDLDLRQDYRA